MPSPQTRAELIIHWIRDPSRDPSFLGNVSGMALLADSAEIVSRFLSLVRVNGFEVELVNNGSEQEPWWAGHWKYRGSSLEGFKQPPDADSVDEARLRACAALLQNDWCKARLE